MEISDRGGGEISVGAADRGDESSDCGCCACDVDPAGALAPDALVVGLCNDRHWLRVETLVRYGLAGLAGLAGCSGTMSSSEVSILSWSASKVAVRAKSDSEVVQAGVGDSSKAFRWSITVLSLSSSSSEAPEARVVFVLLVEGCEVFCDLFLRG